MFDGRILNRARNSLILLKKLGRERRPSKRLIRFQLQPDRALAEQGFRLVVGVDLHGTRLGGVGFAGGEGVGVALAGRDQCAPQRLIRSRLAVGVMAEMKIVAGNRGDLSYFGNRPTSVKGTAGRTPPGPRRTRVRQYSG